MCTVQRWLKLASCSLKSYRFVDEVAQDEQALVLAGALKLRQRPVRRQSQGIRALFFPNRFASLTMADGCVSFGSTVFFSTAKELSVLTGGYGKNRKKNTM